MQNKFNQWEEILKRLSKKNSNISSLFDIDEKEINRWLEARIKSKKYSLKIHKNELYNMLTAQKRRDVDKKLDGLWLPRLKLKEFDLPLSAFDKNIDQILNEDFKEYRITVWKKDLEWEKKWSVLWDTKFVKSKMKKFISKQKKINKNIDDINVVVRWTHPTLNI